MRGYSRTSCIAVCSLCINPLYFYLWRLLKTLVPSSPIQNENTLHQRISATSNTICNLLRTCKKLRQSMIWYFHACIDWSWGYFELFIYMGRCIVNFVYMGQCIMNFIYMGQCIVNFIYMGQCIMNFVYMGQCIVNFIYKGRCIVNFI